MEEIAKTLVLRSFIHNKSVAKRVLVPAAGWRRMSSSQSAVTPVTVERISDNLSFRPSMVEAADHEQRPLVLIYAWLAAKSRHIHKFGDFYLAKGFDVLHVKVGASQILWPPVAQSVISQIIDFVTAPPRVKQPLLIHGFSVGGYLYGETLVRITQDPSLTEMMTKRVKGQIFDSPVDFEGVPRGVGMAVTNIGPAQIAIKSTLDAYLTLFRRQVTQHYIRSSQSFHSNPLRTPSLVLYSKTDVIGAPGPIEVVVNKWRDVGVPVHTKWWPNTAHVGHYLHDPVGYTAQLNNFLHYIGLECQNVTDRIQVPSSKL